MASEHVVEIETLLQPIPGDAPQGTDPRSDRSPQSLYGQIKDARNSARAAERASLFDAEQAAQALAAWRPVLELAPRLLAEQAKDLEVACWYLEALLRQHQSGGLRDGMALLQGLVEQFWEGLFPEPDEDGLETKVAPLTGLNGDGGDGTLLAPLRNLPVSAPGSFAGSGFDCFSYWHYQQAVETDKLQDAGARKERLARLGFSLDDVRQAIAATPTPFLTDLLDDLEAAAASFRQLQDTLRSHCGNEAPPGTAIGSALEEIQRAVRFLGKDRLAQPGEAQEPDMAETTATDQQAAPAATAAVAAGPVASREDAFRQMRELARFFRANEPHSPLASGLERLVRWGNMNVAELMLELMPDTNARSIYSQLTGVTAEDVPGAVTRTAAAPPPAPAPAPTRNEPADDNW